MYSDTAIQCCLMMKVLFHLTLRMTTLSVQSLIHLRGLDRKAPDYFQPFALDKSILILQLVNKK